MGLIKSCMPRYMGCHRESRSHQASSLRGWVGVFHHSGGEGSPSSSGPGTSSSRSCSCPSMTGCTGDARPSMHHPVLACTFSAMRLSILSILRREMFPWGGGAVTRPGGAAVRVALDESDPVMRGLAEKISGGRASSSRARSSSSLPSDGGGRGRCCSAAASRSSRSSRGSSRRVRRAGRGRAYEENTC